jgi:hypothetical protein
VSLDSVLPAVGALAVVVIALWVLPKLGIGS